MTVLIIGVGTAVLTVGLQSQTDEITKFYLNWLQFKSRFQLKLSLEILSKNSCIRMSMKDNTLLRHQNQSINWKIVNWNSPKSRNCTVVHRYTAAAKFSSLKLSLESSPKTLDSLKQSIQFTWPLNRPLAYDGHISINVAKAMRCNLYGVMSHSFSGELAIFNFSVFHVQFNYPN